MNKRHLHHIWTKLRIIKPRYFLLLFVVAVVVSVIALRHNNQTMVKLRNQVFAADQNDGDVEGALRNLQLYVVNHMNTDLASGPNAVYPPIQLKYTYQRLQQAALAQASTVNQQLYTEAQTYCQQQLPTGVSFYRVPCVEQYISTHGLQLPNTSIPVSLYEFSFVSPTWSPDLAGWSLVVAGLALLAGAMVFVVDRWFKRRLQ